MSEDKSCLPLTFRFLGEEDQYACQYAQLSPHLIVKQDAKLRGLLDAVVQNLD